MFRRKKEVDMTDEEYEQYHQKLERKMIHRMRRSARRYRLKSFVQVWYYKRKYDRKYRYENPDYWPLVRELSTPQKIFGFILAHVKFDKDKDIDPVKNIMMKKKVSDKTVILFINNILRYHGYDTYTFWVGYRGSRIIPLSAVILNRITVTLGPESFKVHIGDQFDIMRDYFPRGNRWIIMDPNMEKYIMSYSKGRSERGSPDICVYDDEHWGKARPFAEEILSSLKMKPLSERDEVV